MENKLRAHPAPWRQCIEFVLFQKDENGKRLVGANIEMRKRVPGVVPSPTFSLQEKEAQILMDDLWNAGLRPTEGTGSAGSLKATEKHLEDMRKIVFGHLRSDNPQ